MPVWYLDTSAALKLIVDEPESAALAEVIDRVDPDLVSCRLLETEMRRAAQQAPFIHQDQISLFLDGLDIYDVPAALFRQAALIPGPSLRSLDAIHLAAAIALDVDRMVTYDDRLAAAARELGLDVAHPVP
jgi:hypothetical protein